MCELNSDVIPTSRSSLRHLYFYSNHGPQKHAQKSMLQLVVFVVSLKLDNPGFGNFIMAGFTGHCFCYFFILAFYKVSLSPETKENKSCS